MSKNKYVSADVKKQILERLKNDGVSVSQLAEEHGISSRTIYDWLSKGASSAPSWLEYNKLRRENVALKELLGRVMLETELSKKKN